MTKWRKANKPPQRLTDFYLAAPPQGRQNGARPSSSRAAHTQTAHQAVGRQADTHPEELREFSLPFTPTIRSPAKNRLRREEDEFSPGLQQALSQASMQANKQESLIDLFPATEQTISESTMKNMLLSLKRTLYSGFSDMFAPLNDTVQSHTDKIQQLESKMVDLYSAHNDLVDAYADQESELQCLQNKMADLEDRSRRNNIKFRGIPETIPPMSSLILSSAS